MRSTGNPSKLSIMIMDIYIEPYTKKGTLIGGEFHINIQGNSALYFQDTKLMFSQQIAEQTIHLPEATRHKYMAFLYCFSVTHSLGIW